MKTHNLLLPALLLLLVCPVHAQDSAMVKKPAPMARPHEMPTRRGKGTAHPMPSPHYRSKMVPMPRDTNQARSRLDTVR